MRTPEWYYNSTRKEMLPFVPTAARKVLDVGCGEGNFGALIKKEYGAEVWAIEYNSEAVIKAKEKLDHVLVGDAIELIEELECGAFDCVVILDLLEHLVDPFSFLKKAKHLLNDTGCIVLSVPNVLYISNLYHFLIKKDWKYNNHGILDVTHLRFFTKKSLIKILSELDYNIIELKGINPYRGILFPFFDILTLGHFHEARYLQFALVIEPK